ncbi:hypothetical protein [Bacillus safensis]|uniref:Uncharacterized protein n=1 Tax=Bacillus safensis TaxID=561879 RepID=A0A1L6ZP95_BACIA|nr:hypothetical protein [Bacillus safensis]APT48341.1 hypothetical protein BSA145_20980 [Bacillus safensis]
MKISKAMSEQERIFFYKTEIAELEHIQSYDFSEEREKEIADYRQQIDWENRPNAFRGCNYK